MRISSTALFLALTIFGVGPSRAEGLTPEATLLDGARILAGVQAAQRDYCERPRHNTPQQCNADFKALIEKFLEHSARQMLYLLAEKKGGHNSKNVGQLKREWAVSRESSIEAAKQVEKNYYPPQVLGQAK